MTLAERAPEYRRLVAAEMREAVGDGPEGLFAWMRYHLGWEDQAGTAVAASPGKMMRPVGVLLATEMLGGDTSQAVPAAASIELVHNFSLLHDDVEDASEFRRGRANLWTFAGAAQAINTGDGMFVIARLAQYRMAHAGVPADRAMRVMRQIDEACIDLVYGQFLDISFETRQDVTLEEYVEMAGGKTAAMFSAPFAVGALIAGANDDQVEALREYGWQVGLAFQMVDDILGIWGDPSVTGKPVGDDLLTRKMTFPVICALQSDDEAGASFREAYQTAPGPGDRIDSMARWIETTGARAETEKMAREHQRAAMAAARSAGLDDAALAMLGEYAEAAIGRVT